MSGTRLDGYAEDPQFRRQLNAWRRARFAQFPYLLGQRLPATPNGTFLQAFFQTPEHTIPAFYRGQRVPVGQNECLHCGGTAALLYVDAALVLAERTCERCGGTGSSTRKTYRPYDPGILNPAAGTTARPTRSEAGVRPRKGRSGAPGKLRAVVGLAVFFAAANPVAQPIYAVTHSPGFTVFAALLVSATVAAGLNRLVFGPLREGQVLGPLWILVLPIYLLSGILFVWSFIIHIDALVSLTTSVYELGYSAREALSRVPLGR
jgi:hypothetical protein